ncbi:ABC-type Fe3+/spermidine/putrescine transport system ATPase subunit [Bradyrhizobium sp. i1.3.6]
MTFVTAALRCRSPIWRKATAALLAVAGVSLDIQSGEFLTLLGPSGSGKTTTLMMIAGFESPTIGDIAIDGASVVAVPPYRRNIGMVFQSYALFPHLTVAENVGFPLKQRGVPKAERDRLVGEALELVRLPGYGGRYPRQLSGGQQQRVAVARAIVFKPRLLLLDEPLGALDKQLRENLQIEMRRLHAELAHHLRSCHTRPGRGAHYVRPHRRHERRKGGPDRAARRYLRPAE